ncbi:MAG TPA: hypothetical protein PLV45_01450, partial [bacterium]|nr:hypothetical protein [bacterium]
MKRNTICKDHFTAFLIAVFGCIFPGMPCGHAVGTESGIIHTPDNAAGIPEDWLIGTTPSGVHVTFSTIPAT